MLIKELPDISNEFTPQAYTLREFFLAGDRGFYIPLYQRPYSWNLDNVEQLMDDLVKGIDSVLTDAKSVSFLGTVILCAEQNKKKNIEPVDLRALPLSVYNVIDGQQRISTLALLATRLYRATRVFINSLGDDEFYEEITDYLEGQIDDLQRFFCLSLSTRKANPKEKPVIIRGSHDEWTLDGPDEKYTSTVSHYLAAFIRELGSKGIDIPDKRTTLGRNLKLIDLYIKIIINAHKQTETHISYPDAKNILRHIDQELIWGFDRDDYKNYVLSNDYNDKKCSNISTAIQLCMLFHYFFDRACLSVIYPTSEDWAFDIFQSLNATGTPLTAIETFKPLVVNTVNKGAHFKYKGSKSEEYFASIDYLFEVNDTAEQKSKLTKEYLNVFRLVYEGKSLSNHFSHQRKWLNDTYGSLGTAQKQEELIHRLSNLAKYWSNVKWFDSTSMTCFSGCHDLSDRNKELTVLCVRYLDDASHRMADTLLSRFYALVIRNTENAVDNFSQASKSIAAFFTLWRSALPNTGLDEVYRKLLEDNDDNETPNYSWASGIEELSIHDLKRYFLSVLAEKGITDKDAWLTKAYKNLRYDTAKTVCKFALLVSAHDTIADPDDVGLMKKGALGVSKYLDDSSWRSTDLKTIEHVAPQSNENGTWDVNIYSDQLEHSIGNLTLLPVDINSSIGNKSWQEKVLYYKHLALDDPGKSQNIRDEALHEGYILADETLELLTSARYASHMKSIVDFADADKAWDKVFIEKRAKRICELLWDELHPWLENE